MPGRTHSTARCTVCRMYWPLCLCSEIAPRSVSTRLIVVMHCREAQLTTNTAHLACLMLPNSEIRLRAGRYEPARGLVHPDTSAALLFPSDDAVELTPELARSLPRPLTLFVPDGSWKQARKVHTREPELRSVLRVKLPPGPPSRYRLRHSPHAMNLSTFEAIARAMGVLESPTLQQEMETLFLKMVERTLWSRGVLPPALATTGIPQAAFDAAEAAGRRGSVHPNRT